eukprot:362786-Chlamydomonas_euryale.AAC.2
MAFSTFQFGPDGSPLESRVMVGDAIRSMRVEINCSDLQQTTCEFMLIYVTVRLWRLELTKDRGGACVPKKGT